MGRLMTTWLAGGLGAVVALAALGCSRGERREPVVRRKPAVQQVVAQGGGTPQGWTGGPLGPQTGLATPGADTGFGLTKERAVNVCMPEGEQRYLSAQSCPDGSAPSFNRVGNVGPRNPSSGSYDMNQIDPNYRLPPGAVDVHIIDQYDVRCGGGVQVQVFMDMYHCSDPDPLLPIGPLRPRGHAGIPPANMIAA